MARKTASIIGESKIPYGDLRGTKREWSKRFLTRIKELPEAETSARAFSLAPELNVVGIGIAEKMVDNLYMGVTCITFFVRSKQSNSHLLRKHRLPKSIDGLPVDVQEVGTFYSLAASRRAVRRRRATSVAVLADEAAPPDPRIEIRPVQPGCSIGFLSPSGFSAKSGTFGALVRDSNGLYILSNNHVLACENDALRPVGAAVHQPSPEHKFNPGRVAGLTRLKHLDPTAPNKVDCAIAQVSDTGSVSNSILHIGPPLGKAEPFIGMEVHKFGAKTDYRVGRVVSPETDVFFVDFNPGLYSLKDQIVIESIGNNDFADKGDSGALVLERTTQKAIGIVCAGSINNGRTVTLANRINDVLSALGVSLVL